MSKGCLQPPNNVSWSAKSLSLTVLTCGVTAAEPAWRMSCGQCRVIWKMSGVCVSQDSEVL